MSQPVTQQPVTQQPVTQPDPYAEFGGSTTPAPTATPSPNTGSDPYAEFGGSVTPPTTGATGTTPPVDYTERLHQIEQQPFSGSAWNRVKQVGETLSAAADVLASNTLDAVKGAVHALNPNPQTPEELKARTYGTGLGAMYVYRMLNGLSPIARAAIHPTEIAKAIHDINASKDPTGTYLEIARDTALKGAGQALTAIGTEGVVKGGVAAAPKIAEGVTHIFRPETGEVEAVPKPAAVPKTGIVKQVLQGKKVAQPGAQSAVREAVQTGVTTANDATAAREAAQSNVKIPDAYKDLVNEAMNQEPAWTPEKAQPIVKALGDDFEVKGSVGEGKSTNNDLDIWQKNGDISAAADALKKNGFKYSHDTPHGEVWTKGDQNIDLWDSAHEPKPGFGPDIPESEPAPVANKRSSAVGNNAPLVKGNTTILDDHLDTLAENEKATYKRMDDTAGFDVKALKDKLKIDKYNLKQLGSSDPDKVGRLVEAINDSTDRIAEANEKMKAAGIDPDEADALHQQRMAGEDFKKVLTTYTNADGSVNVKGLLRGSKQLRFSQYGDRLEQLTGSSDAADKFINQLDAMDKLGAHAIKAQKIAKMIGWGLAIPTGLKVAGSIAHDVLVP